MTGDAKCQLRLSKKMLVVTAGLPPAQNGSSSIMTNLARYLTPNEAVFVGELSPGPANNAWPNSSDLPQIFYIHRQWPWKFKKTIRFLLWPLILWRALMIYRREKCQQVMAVFPNEAYLSIGYFVSLIMGCNLYSYFHNTYLDNRTGVRRWWARILQPLVFRRSKIVFVMSEGMKRVWSKMYPDVRFETLVHTENQSPLQPRTFAKIPDDFRVAVMGSLNESNLEAMGRLRHILEAFPQMQLSVYSTAKPSVLKNLGLDGPRVRQTSAAYDQIVAELGGHDLLFLPHGFIGGFKPIEYETIFPTRTLPYLLSAVPIIAHSPPGAFLTDFLRENQSAVVVDTPSETALIAAFQNLRDDPREQARLVKNGLVAAQKFQGERVVDHWCQQVDSTESK